MVSYYFPFLSLSLSLHVIYSSACVFELVIYSIEVNQLEQLITEPTRTTETSSTLLDLLITSTPNPFTSANVIKAGISDHFSICGVLSTKSDQVLNHRIIETRKVDLEANHETFLNELSCVPWNLMDLFQNPDDKL